MLCGPEIISDLRFALDIASLSHRIHLLLSGVYKITCWREDGIFPGYPKNGLGVEFIKRH
jgi:hypothetical protein